MIKYYPSLCLLAEGAKFSTKSHEIAVNHSIENSPTIVIIDNTNISAKEGKTPPTVIDADGNEDVDLQEFRTWWNTYSSREMITEAMDPHEQYLKKTFDAADANQDGKLDKGELRELMGYLGEADFEFAMAAMDDGGEGGQAGDGAIDFEEFKMWYDVLVTVDFLCDESGGCLPPFETTFDFSLLQKVAILAAKKLDIASRDQFLDDDLVLAAFGVPPSQVLTFEQVQTWWQDCRPEMKVRTTQGKGTTHRHCLY